MIWQWGNSTYTKYSKEVADLIDDAMEVDSCVNTARSLMADRLMELIACLPREVQDDGEWAVMPRPKIGFLGSEYMTGLPGTTRMNSSRARRAAPMADVQIKMPRAGPAWLL